MYTLIFMELKDNRFRIVNIENVITSSDERIRSNKCAEFAHELNPNTFGTTDLFFMLRHRIPCL